MLRPHVLAALASGISVGDDDAARAHLRTIDPVLRGPAKRRLERALIDAALSTTSSEPVHVMCIAALAIAKRPVDVNDHDAVTTAYRALPPVAPSRAPIATIAAALAGIAIAAAIALVIVTRPGPAQRAYVRPLPLPAAGAYKDGGVPLPDPAIAKLLGEELTSFIIATDRDRNTPGEDPQRAATAKELAASPVMQKTPGLAAAWQALIADLDAWVTHASAELDFDETARAFRTKVRAVSDQFIAAGIGYYLEGTVRENRSGAHALIYSYRVEEVAFVNAQREGGPEKRRVLGLRRLDNLNMTHSLLGMQSQELGDPVLLFDQIDGFVVTDVIPVLAPKADYPLGDRHWVKDAQLVALAGEVARTEWMAALGADAERTTQIAALFAERATILDKWSAVLEGRGWRMNRTESLFVPPALIDQLEGVVTNQQRDRVRAIEEKLAELEGPRVASRLLEMIAGTVRRHEAQHGMDDDRPAPLRYPEVLAQWVGPEIDDKGRPRRSADRARNELAAYLSQIANDPALPRVTLLGVARFAFDDSATNTPESYAGIAIIEGLARHLAIPSPGPVVHQRRIDRDRMAVLLRALLEQSGEKIRFAATKLWTELFGEAIVPILDR